jgi:molybdate transport system ATP-binding protein
MAESSALFVEVRQTGPIPLDVQFTCEPGQVLAIYGPSGSGKTTLLRTVAGLYRPSHAVVRCGADDWTDTGRRVHVPTRERRVGFVFQEYALFPHLTARGNVQTAVEGGAGEPDRWLAATHLTDVAHRRPDELSGGQRQRVAVARALARDPHVLLLDEPFSAVDRGVRAQLHNELDELRRRTRIPVLLVTHDFQDVVRMATHVLLLDRGRGLAAGPIADMTSRADVPWSQVLTDAGSVIEGSVRKVDAGRQLAEVAFDGGSFLVPQQSLQPGTAVRLRVPARDVILASRPPEGLSLHNVLKGVVAAVNHTADDHRLVQVAIGKAHVLAEVTPDAVQRLGLAPGAEVYALIKSVSIDVHKNVGR